MNFETLGINSVLAECVEHLAYDEPTPVQVATIPVILDGCDVLAAAQTGTGKTAAFALPILHKLMTRPQTEKHKISILVLTPTRELAQQVHASFIKYSKGLAIKSVLVFGGASINPQLAALKQGCDIVIATPGRLLDFIQNKLIDLSHLSTLVLDEADRMLDMGFIVDINRIQKHLPSTKQTLLFSATFSDDIFAISKSMLRSPQLVEVNPRNTAVEKIEQIFYHVDKSRKSQLISYLIGSQNWRQVLIFTRTKQGADSLSEEMKKDGIATESIHGDKSQGARERILANFKEGKIRALVATDLAARGLDIKQLQYVINHELPYQPEDYIHRIGRTGRAGSLGFAVSLFSEKERYLLTDIEKHLDQHFVVRWFEGFEPDLNSSSEKSNRGMSKKAMRAQAIAGTSKKKNKPNRRR